MKSRPDFFTTTTSAGVCVATVMVSSQSCLTHLTLKKGWNRGKVKNLTPARKLISYGYGTATKSSEVNEGTATGMGATATSSLAEPVGSLEVISEPSVT